jgi:hypothetical protein
MATMIVAALVLAFGVLFAAMAVTPMVLEELSAKPDVSKRATTPVSFECRDPRIAPAHEAQAA